MSYYLVSRLEHSPNVRIHTGSEVQILRGGERLESVTIVNGPGNARRSRPRPSSS